MMGNDYYGHGAGWEGWVMVLFMIVFVVAAVIAIIYFVRYFAQPQATQAQLAQPQAAQFVAPSAAAVATESAQDIVRRRYASGEIERDEYLQKLGDL